VSRLLPAFGAVALLALSSLLAAPPIAAAPKATAKAPALSAQDNELLAGLAEAYHLSREKGAKVWPGFELHSRPLALFDRGRAVFLINHPKPPRGFVLLARGTPLPLGTRIHVRYGPTADFDQANSLGIPLNGLRTTLLPYPFFFYDGAVTSRDFVSALFASYVQHGFGQFSGYEKHADERFSAYPTDDVENMAMADLENKMLAVALHAENLELAKRNALWFVAMRRERQERLGKSLRTYEDHAEAIEGSTRFAEIMYTAAGTSNYQPLRSPFLKLSGYAPERELVRQISGLLHQTVDSNSVRRDRFSLTGSAMALLLDRLGAQGWRRQVTSGGEALDDVLARAVDFSETQREALLKEGRRVYAYDRTLKELEDTVGRMPTSLKAFNASAGTRLTVTLHPVASLVELDSEPSRSGRDGLAIASSASPVEIDAWTLLAAKLEAFDYKKGSLSLVVKGRPLLLRSKDLSWPFQNVSFYANTPKLKMTLDGKVMPFQEGSQLFTRGLRIEGDGLLLKAGRGTLIVGPDEIQVVGR